MFCEAVDEKCGDVLVDEAALVEGDEIGREEINARGIEEELHHCRGLNEANGIDEMRQCSLSLMALAGG